jgi:hypothetical protein
MMARDTAERQDDGKLTLTADETKKLKHIVKRSRELHDQKKEIAKELKELETAAWEKCEVKPKVLRKAIKESGYSETELIEQRYLEESLDQVRSALGLFADLPLGEHAVARAERRKKEKAEAQQLN